MFHSNYIPDYFSLKQLKQLRDYNINVKDLYYNDLPYKNKENIGCASGLCNFL